MYFYVLYKNRNEIQTRNEEDDPRTTLSPAASSIAFLYEAYEPKVTSFHFCSHSIC